MKNSKTDVVDADTLAQYAERMNFVACARPSDERSPCAVSPAASMRWPARKLPPKNIEKMLAIELSIYELLFFVLKMEL